MSPNYGHLKKTAYIHVLIVLILCSLFTPIANCAAEGSGDYPPPSEGNWIIENETYISDEVVVIDGNITVMEGAILSLDNVTLLINSSLSNMRGIYVDGGATLNINNSNVTALYGHYTFEIYGNMNMNHTKVSRTTGGIRIQYDDVLIANSTIFNNVEFGLICFGNPIIFNNTIHSNYAGILSSFFGAPFLINNTIISNEWGVICNYGGSAKFIGNDISNNTSGGISAELSHLELHNNTISSNGGFGVRGTRVSINATNNTIYDNERWGIYSFGALIVQENNTFVKDDKKNGEGNVLQEWEFHIEIFNTTNATIDKVNLTILDQHTNEIWSGDTIGNFRTITLREYEILNDGVEVVHTPFTIIVSKGTSINYTIVDLKNNKDTTIVLDYKEDNYKDEDDQDGFVPTIEEYKFPVWGAVVVSIIWIIVLILMIIGLMISLRNNRGRPA